MPSIKVNTANDCASQQCHARPENPRPAKQCRPALHFRPFCERRRSRPLPQSSRHDSLITPITSFEFSISPLEAPDPATIIAIRSQWTRSARPQPQRCEIRQRYPAFSAPAPVGAFSEIKGDSSALLSNIHSRNGSGLPLRRKPNPDRCQPPCQFKGPSHILPGGFL